MLVIPFFYQVRSLKDVGNKFVLLWNDRLQIVLAACVFMIPWIPQMIYWKYYTGTFLFYTYGEEGFYFFNPQLFNVLLSYRKGWLVYTPIMVFALIGFFFMKKKCPDQFWGVLIQ